MTKATANLSIVARHMAKIRGSLAKVKRGVESGRNKMPWQTYDGIMTNIKEAEQLLAKKSKRILHRYNKTVRHRNNLIEKVKREANSQPSV